MQYPVEGNDMTRNLLLTLCYDGTKYHGWQIQKNALSVQEVFQGPLYRILGGEHDIKGCSRTDTGVHAREYCISVATKCPILPQRLMAALNNSLPRDMAVLSCREVPLDFHARYSCIGKEYIYQIWNGAVRNPFYEGYALQYPYALDVELLNRAAAQYLGEHDFSSFCSAGSKVEDTVRRVTVSEVTREGDMVLFRTRADGYLYNMVRIMVGTLLRVAQGKISPEEIPEILKACDRSKAGPTAPAEGLYLNKVLYGGLEE